MQSRLLNVNAPSHAPNRLQGPSFMTSHNTEGDLTEMLWVGRVFSHQDKQKFRRSLWEEPLVNLLVKYSL